MGYEIRVKQCNVSHVAQLISVITANGEVKNYLYKACRRQFIETYDPPPDYSDELKRECLKLYVNSTGFTCFAHAADRAIERVKDAHHTTVITWVKQTGGLLPDAYNSEITPEVGELMETRLSTRPT